MSDKEYEIDWNKLADRNLDRQIAELLGAVFEGEWFTDSYGQKRVAPYFTVDLNLAIKLVPNDQRVKFHLEHLLFDDTYKWRAEFYPAGGIGRIEYYSVDNPALAICQAWLEWQRRATQPPPTDEAQH